MADAGLQGTDQWDALQREIAETEQKLKSLNQEMDRFGSVSAQKVAAAGEKVQKVGQDLESAGRAIMPASVAMIGFGTVAASKYADVDRTMTLTNQTMGNTTEQAEMLDRAMADAAANSTFGMSDAANATLNFARAGLTAEQAAAALAPAMNLAAGEGGSLDTVSAGLVATINGFGDSFGNAGHYADVFAAACNNSALDVDSLSGAMSVAAPIFSAAGYSVNDAALYMGIMANNGIEADKAANSLKTGIARLVSPAKEGAEANCGYWDKEAKDTLAEREHQKTLKKKEEAVENVRELHATGLSKLAISKETGLCYRTVTKYLKADYVPSHSRYGVSDASPLKPFADKIRQALTQGLKFREIEQVIREEGYQGASSTIRMFASRERRLLKSGANPWKKWGEKLSSACCTSPLRT